MKKILIYIISGIFIFVFGFLAGSFWTTIIFTNFHISGLGEIEEYSDSSFQETSFWENKFFGGMFGRRDKLKTLPDGKGYLTGKFIYNGKPAVGIKFKMYLNNKYKTGPIVTDENGAFIIRLQSGRWSINSIECQKWKNKPEGSFILVSGDEERIESSLQDLFFGYNTGKEAIVTDKRPVKEHITLTVNKRIKVIWPEIQILKQEATIAHSKIKWEHYPEAKDYVIKIDRITRESPRSTIYSPIVFKKTSGENSFPLSKLAHTRDPVAKEEYAIKVQAYGKNGEFLSESEHFQGTFSLIDGNVLVESQDYEMSVMEDRIEDIFEDRKLVHAVEILIKEKMFNEAESILKKIKEDDAVALTGYLYAAKGDCIKAQKFFNIAIEKKGQGCISEEYKANCK